jgi:hypothetical protein
MENTNTTQITYKFKLSKTDIIQRLLEDKYITVEEAMTLMANDAPITPMSTPPYTPPVPNIPQYPGTYPWPITYCQSHTNPPSAEINSNFTAK